MKILDIIFDIWYCCSTLLKLKWLIYYTTDLNFSSIVSLIIYLNVHNIIFSECVFKPAIPLMTCNGLIEKKTKQNKKQKKDGKTGDMRHGKLVKDVTDSRTISTGAPVISLDSNCRQAD